MAIKDLLQQSFEVGRLYGADLEFGSYASENFEHWYNRVGKQFTENKQNLPDKHPFIDLLIEEVEATAENEGIWFSGNDDELNRLIPLYKEQ